VPPSDHNKEACGLEFKLSLLDKNTANR
jgi:hypothetical protein